jgi:hypothetical protein
MILNPTQHQARSFAIEAHADQRYGDRPYSYHLDAVAALAAPYGEEAVVVAYLHDTAEDTKTTIAEIEGRFGPRIAACVSLLTDEPGVNRKERKAKTYAKLAGVRGPNELALLVKAADRLANVRACIEDRKKSLWQLYRSEHEMFRASAYRAGLCEPLWAELDQLLGGSAFDPEGGEDSTSTARSSQEATMSEPSASNEYLLLSRGQWDPRKSKEEIQAAIDSFYAWHEQLVAQGTFKSGQRLATDGKLVTRTGVIDGPFAEAKEIVGGYWFIVAGSLQEAADIAAQNPCLACGLAYEIRPIERERASAFRDSNETPPGTR